MNEDDTFNKLKYFPITPEVVNEALHSENLTSTAEKYGYKPDDFRKACREHYQKMFSTLQNKK